MHLKHTHTDTLDTHASQRLLLFRQDHAHVRWAINAAFKIYGNNGPFRMFFSFYNFFFLSIPLYKCASEDKAYTREARNKECAS